MANLYDLKEHLDALRAYHKALKLEIADDNPEVSRAVACARTHLELAAFYLRDAIEKKES
jgi:hypothetical protein